MLDDSLIYRGSSPFQEWAYSHAAHYFYERGIRRYGLSKDGNPYAHLLHPDDSGRNFLAPGIAAALAERFDRHRAGDRARAETNTVASQTCCFNLFVPLARDLGLASAVIGDLIGGPVSVDHVELEFTPNQLADLPGYELRGRDESLGDQSGSGGTDADVAVFYRAGGERGVLVVEVKYLESAFSTCKSYRSKSVERKLLLQPLCDSAAFTAVVTEPRRDDRGRLLCGYAKYDNWELTRASVALDWEKIARLPGCPFAGSAQQLWRNLLLAENVARQRRLADFQLWAIAPKKNEPLWNESGGHVFQDFARLLRTDQPSHVRWLDMELVLETIEARLPLDDARRQWWTGAFRQRYLAAT